MNLRGGENEYNMLRRLLHNLEQSVSRLFGEHVRFVYDINTVLCNSRSKVRFGAQIPNIVNVSVAGGVHFGNIQQRTVVNSPADFTFAAGLAVVLVWAVHRLCKDFRAGGFAYAAAAGEDVCMTEGVLRHLFCNDGGYVLLPGNVLKKSRAIFAIKRLIHKAPPIL